MHTYIVDKFVDAVVVPIASPCPVVSATLKGLYVFQWRTTSLGREREQSVETTQLTVITNAQDIICTRNTSTGCEALL